MVILHSFLRANYIIPNKTPPTSRSATLEAGWALSLKRIRKKRMAKENAAKVTVVGKGTAVFYGLC